MGSDGASDAPSGGTEWGFGFVAFGIVGAAWVAVHAFGLLGEFAALTFVLLGVVTVVATLVGVRRHKPSRRWPWLVNAAALVVFLAGGVAREILGTTGDLSDSRSLLPDLITLPGYLLVALGVGGFARARQGARRRDLSIVLDGIIASLAALMVAWAYLITPALFHGSAPLSVRVVLACYPPMSVFLVAVAARVAFVAGRRPTISQRCLVMALLCVLVGDVFYMLYDAQIASVPRQLVDVPYALAYLLFALSALHPSMTSLSEAVTTAERAPRRSRLVLISATLALPAIVAVTQTRPLSGDALVLGGIILVLTGMASWRIFRALRDQATSEARLLHQATHDALTDLPNRLYATEFLNLAIRRAATRDDAVAVLFLDVDRFKLVNDMSGHSVGDELLVAIGERLRQYVRPGDVVARIGGDEFIVIFDNVSSLPYAKGLAERVHNSFEMPFVVRGQAIYSSASLGVAFSGPDTLDAERLIRDADTAMYEAKDAGRDGVAVFDASMRDRVAERVALEQELRVALVSAQLHVHYQPILSMTSGRMESVEALIRWTHPTRGLVPPFKFIPIAEDVGLISEIGLWVINEACRETARWRQVPSMRDLYVAVNLSPRQLRDDRLVESVTAILARHGLPGNALCLEITESMLMSDPAAAADVLWALKRLGVRLSIDDFGTGYSSLSYLKRFPVDHVKIDRSFVEGLGESDTSEESLVAAIIAMAAALRMTTIAEGVETVAQANRLRELRCDRVQGFLYSRPLPPKRVPEAARRLSSAAVESTLAETPRLMPQSVGP